MKTTEGGKAFLLSATPRALGEPGRRFFGEEEEKEELSLAHSAGTPVKTPLLRANSLGIEMNLPLSPFINRPGIEHKTNRLASPPTSEEGGRKEIMPRLMIPSAAEENLSFPPKSCSPVKKSYQGGYRGSTGKEALVSSSSSLPPFLCPPALPVPWMA